MIARVIDWSLAHRGLVLVLAACLAVAGAWSWRQTPVDVLPDLSDVQVIVRTTWPGRAPQVVEDQVTYPLSTAMLGVPGARTVRATSLFGDSFVHVLFEDGTDLYWARARVQEALAQVQSRLPANAVPVLGPDATGVGWIYQYALVDRSGRHDLADLRALQDWFLKFELKQVKDVAEVAPIGGMVRGYRVVLDPERLQAFGLDAAMVMMAITRGQGAGGGGVVELAEAEYMVRTQAWIDSIEALRALPVRAGGQGAVVTLADVATIERGPEMRRGIAELDGEGEVAGAVVVLRSGGNARAVIAAVKARLAELAPGLPEGVEIVETYDRSQLIDRAVANLEHKLVEEFIVVAIVCAVFLLHLRSALVAIVALPLGILAAFVLLRAHGLNANLMSLGGLAIAIGAMVDASIVLVENAHKHLEHFAVANGRAPVGAERWQVIRDASVEVGPALFTSLLIITLSFLPVFALQAQEGRLFGPLALTKTYAMAAAAGLSVTLVPVLMGWLVRGRIRPESDNPVTRALVGLYGPLLHRALAWPKLTLAIAAAVLVASLWPATRLGGEFLPMVDEGDVLYMPTTLPGLSARKASELLAVTDRLLRQVPEVAQVFGKIGRAESATDPAPLEMVETTIRFRPRSEWRPGMTPAKLIEELDRQVRLPGVANLFIPPIRNRIDMLSTGVKSPIGIRISGPELAEIDRLGSVIESLARPVPGVASVLAERQRGGRYLDIRIDRIAAAQYGLDTRNVLETIDTLIGGEAIAETVEGRRRFPISLRTPRELRDQVVDLRVLPIVAPGGARLRLGDVATIAIAEGPAMIKSENARPSGLVFVDVRGRDLNGVVADLKDVLARNLELPAGYSLSWTGQFEASARATERMRVLVPVTLLITALLLHFCFGRLDETLLILGTLPFALVGGVWLLWLLGHALSVASLVGFIALAGVAAEFGVVMLLYLKQAWARRLAAGEPADARTLHDAIVEGAVQRVRPKAMTVAVIVAGLLPILLGTGSGAELMHRIAAPMLGGMLTAPLLSLFVVPVVWQMLRGRVA